VVGTLNRERRCKIVTIEDPIEFVHQRKKAIIVQQEVHTDVLSYSAALVHVLRQDPDVIVIGEMRDLETIAAAITAAETGHLVIATLHTPNVSQTVERIVAVFPPSQQPQIVLQLANSIQGVVTQDLLPRAVRTEGEGLVLATEVLVATSGVRNMIRENSIHLLYNAIQTGHQHGMVTMDRTLMDLYEQGVITYDVAISRMRDPTALQKRDATAAPAIRRR
jgi:twitching motility protein PilT